MSNSDESKQRMEKFIESMLDIISITGKKTGSTIATTLVGSSPSSIATHYKQQASVMIGQLSKDFDKPEPHKVTINEIYINELFQYKLFYMNWLQLSRRLITRNMIENDEINHEEETSHPHICTSKCRLIPIENTDFSPSYYCVNSGNVHLCGTKCTRCSTTKGLGGYVCELTSKIVAPQFCHNMAGGVDSNGQDDNGENGATDNQQIYKERSTKPCRSTLAQVQIDEEVKMRIKNQQAEQNGKLLSKSEKKEIRKQINPYERRQVKIDTDKLRCNATNWIALLAPSLSDPIKNGLVGICMNTYIDVMKSEIYLKKNKTYEFFYHIICVMFESQTGFKRLDGIFVIPFIDEMEERLVRMNEIHTILDKGTKTLSGIKFKMKKYTETSKLMKLCLGTVIN